MTPTNPGAGEGGTGSTPPNAGGGAGNPEPQDACSGAEEAFATMCPDMVSLYVSPAGSPEGPALASAPTSSLELVRTICAAQACHVYLAEGTYAYDSALPIAGPCVHIEGGLVPTSQGSWLSRGGPSVVVQQYHEQSAFAGALTGGKLLLESVTVNGGYVGVKVDGANVAVVKDSTFATDYGGIEAVWGANGVRVCSTEVTGSEIGVSVSWESYNVVLQDVTIQAEVSGVSVSWESHGVDLRDVTIDAGENAVDVGTSSYAVTMTEVVARGAFSGVTVGGGASNVVATNSELEGDLIAASIAGGRDVHLLDGRLVGGPVGALKFDFIHGAWDVHVIGNYVRGALPASDPGRQIEIRDNIVEP